MRKGSAARTAEQGWELPTAPPPPVSSFLTTRCFPRQSREMVNAGGAPGAAPWLRPPPPSPPRRDTPGRTGMRRDAAVRSRAGARAAGGTIFCLCSYFCAGGTNREVVFCSLIAAHKHSAYLSRCCSTVTERRSRCGKRGASRSAATGRWPSHASLAVCADFCAVFPVEAANLREFLLSQF